MFLRSKYFPPKTQRSCIYAILIHFILNVKMQISVRLATTFYGWADGEGQKAFEWDSFPENTFDEGKSKSGKYSEVGE